MAIDLVGFRQPLSSTKVNEVIIAANKSTADLALLLGGIGLLQQRATADLTVTGAASDITGAVINVTTTTPGAVVGILGVFDIEVTAAVTGVWTAQGQCTVDGVVQAGVATFEGPNGSRDTVSQVWVASLATPGPHALRLRGLRSGTGGTVIARSIHTAITALVLDF